MKFREVAVGVASAIGGAATTILLVGVLFSSYGTMIEARGFRAVIYRDSATSTWRAAQFNPSARITAVAGTPEWSTQYAARYGHTLASCNGRPMSERYSDEALREVANATSNPLQLSCNPDCEIGDESEWEYDSKMVGVGVVSGRDPQTGAIVPVPGMLAWDAVVEPAYRALHPIVPAPTPTPDPPPVTPTPPPPISSDEGLGFAQIPCPDSDSRSTGQLCIHVWNQ
jgi:hypothetical protein